jgi:hypothetical protein
VAARDGWTPHPGEPNNSWAERNRFQVNDTLGEYHCWPTSTHWPFLPMHFHACMTRRARCSVQVRSPSYLVSCTRTHHGRQLASACSQEKAGAPAMATCGRPGFSPLWLFFVSSSSSPSQSRKLYNKEGRKGGSVVLGYPLIDRETTRTTNMARVGVAVLALLSAVAACLPAPPAEASSAADLGGLQALTAKAAPAKCSGAVGECGVDEDEELGLGGVGEALRRSMAQRQPTSRYIGYAALRADQVPCNKRGRSYYTNCASQQKANPYRRGCSAITRCQRNTN